MIILALDSGLERTGYALVEKKNTLKNFKYITSGVFFTSNKSSLPLRIFKIYNFLNKLIEQYKPDCFVLEKLFFFANKKTAISVSQVQGSVLLLAEQKKINLVFLTPLQVKQTVTGYGRADKKGVKKIIHLTLPETKKITQDDEIDAIAIAVTYCLLN
ncbi:MAG: crossover junction endodeoxyribonuclease RuvC [Microgenomates group bacterium]|nr:crossover junction endodeoxyribonuclease RuvC [Microgenomates group bacterium]